MYISCYHKFALYKILNLEKNLHSSVTQNKNYYAFYLKIFDMID